MPPTQEASSIPNIGRGSAREAGTASVFAREEYHSAIRGLGSAKNLVSQSLSQPQFTSTPAVSANSRSALVPEEEYLADDWLEDDLGEIQPKKKRRVVAEQSETRRECSTSSSVARDQNWHSAYSGTSSRGESSVGAITLSQAHL